MSRFRGNVQPGRATRPIEREPQTPADRRDVALMKISHATKPGPALKSNRTSGKGTPGSQVG